MPDEIRVGFTNYQSSYGFGKSVSLDPATGEIVKKAVITMSSGKFETIEMDWLEFGSYLSGLQPGESLGYGVCNRKAQTTNGLGFLRSGRIITIREEATTKIADTVARTDKNFSWHQAPCNKSNILFIDMDDLHPGSTIEDCVENLFQLFPALGKLPGGCWAFASAGSNIIRTFPNGGEVDAAVSGLTGLHVYFALPNIITITEAVEYLKVTAWLNRSMGFKIKAESKFKLCKAYERGPIDFTVFQTNRLDFIGGMLCAEGLRQDRGEPTHFIDNELILSGGIVEAFSLSAAQKAEAEQLLRAAKCVADAEVKPINDAIKAALGRPGSGATWMGSKHFAALEEDQLPGLLDITFSNGEVVPVWKLIFFPEKYHDKSCFDPMYPEKGGGKATFYWNGRSGGVCDRENLYIIGSFVHGGINYKLQTDIDGVREMLKKTDAEEARGRLYAGDGNWLRELACLDAALELPEILEILKKRGIMDKAEARTKIGAEMVPDLEVEKVEALGLMNERFAYVPIEGKARYVEDVGGRLTLRCRNDFLADVENLPMIRRWNGTTGKVTYVKAGDAWLSWDGRRGYPGGLRFEPGIADREFEDPDGAGLVLNRFRGFSVVPARKCPRVECGGRGCFEYFFDEVSLADRTCAAGDSHLDLISLSDLNVQPGICPVVGTWTRWLRTIFDAVCGGNIEHTRWVLDWFCDIIQAPGGRAGIGSAGFKRSGVSLVVRGGQGTGKDSIVEPMMSILDKYAITLTEIQQISQNFNAYLEDCLLVFGNELIWGGEKRAGNKMKEIITGKSLRIEPKGLDSYQAKNFVRFFAASNSEWVIPAEEDERRYTVFDIGSKYCKNAEWFIAMKSGDLGELLELILKWKITSDLNKNLETEALNNQKELGHRGDSVVEFLEMAIEEGWFWGKNGIGEKVSNQEIDLKYEEHFQVGGKYGDNAFSFRKKMKKWMKDRNYTPGDKIRMGDKILRGFQFPTIEWLSKQASNLKKIYDRIDFDK